MTRREFIDALSGKLSEELSSAEVLSQVQYYQGYIDGELHKGRTEEEVLDELGDPNLIAKNIIESPRDDDPFFGNTVPDGQDAYEEGAYQGSHSKSEETLQREAEASRRATESQYRKAAAAAKAARESFAEKRAEKAGAGGETSAGAQEEQKEKSGAGAGNQADSAARKDSGEPSDRDAGPEKGVVEGGGFNWTLFAFIIAAVIIVAAIIWAVVSVVTALGPTLLIILAIVLILFTIFGSRRRQ